MSYPLKSYGNDNLLHFHLDDVDCDGTESTLSGIGNHNCFEGEEAGVVCNSKLCVKQLYRHSFYCGSLHLAPKDNMHHHTA